MNFKKIWYLITLKLDRLKSRKATMTAVEDLNVTKCNKFSFGSKDQRYKMEKPDPN